MLSFPIHPRRYLTAQLFWRFFLLSLPVLLVGAAALCYAVLWELRVQASENLAVIAADRASKIEAFARGKLRDIQFLAAQPYMPGLVAEGKTTPEQETSLTFLRNVGDYQNLFLFSQGGKLLFSQNPHDAPTPELTSTIDRTRTLMSSEISNYTLDPVTKTPAVYVAAPIFGPGGAISGVIAARLDNQEIYRVVNDYGSLGQTGETVIGQTEGDRVVIVAPLRNAPNAAFNLSFAPGEVPPALAAAVDGIRLQAVNKDYRGIEALSVSRYLPSLGWGLVVKIDASEIFAPAANLLQGILIGAIVFFLLFAIGAQAAAQSLNRPLKMLTKAAQKIEEGDLSARAGLDDRLDEFGYLGRAFDGMASRVEQATESLRQTNVLLEQKVAERTKDLEAKTIEAERANYAKNEFLANMSHELRTPLNGILGYAQILGNLPLAPKALAGIRIIRQSGEHLLTLINDILDLAKIEARKIEITPTDVLFRDFLRGPVDMFQIRAEQKGIAFEVELSPDLPEVVMADEKRLRQVVINLLGNAVKFTDKGRVRFTVAPQDGKIRFAFVDTGIGIPPTKIAQLFKPFSQVADAERNAEGTGLGLVLSQRLVQLMGGTIEIESEFGKGSTFSFALDLPSGVPCAFLAKASESSTRITGYAGKRRKILVADDIPANRSVLVEMLSPLGFLMVEAKDGRVALDLLPKERPDLVLVDIAMPVLDGLQFTQYARQIKAFQDLPIVPTSASVGEEEIKRCRDLGCVDFLTKPVDYATLLECLRRRLELEWIITEATTPAVQETVDSSPLLSPEIAAQFADLARRGDLLGLQKTVEQFVSDNPAYRPFLDRLRKLCEGFRVRQIRQLIEEHTPPAA
jgi:signal transduction histidine kinase/DNA-binding NarL/FixJ family response regulator